MLSRPQSGPGWSELLVKTGESSASAERFISGGYVSEVGATMGERAFLLVGQNSFLTLRHTVLVTLGNMN